MQRISISVKEATVVIGKSREQRRGACLYWRMIPFFPQNLNRMFCNLEIFPSPHKAWREPPILYFHLVKGFSFVISSVSINCILCTRYCSRLWRFMGIVRFSVFRGMHTHLRVLPSSGSKASGLAS